MTLCPLSLEANNRRGRYAGLGDRTLEHQAHWGHRLLGQLEPCWAGLSHLSHGVTAQSHTTSGCGPGLQVPHRWREGSHADLRTACWKAPGSAWALSDRNVALLQARGDTGGQLLSSTPGTRSGDAGVWRHQPLGTVWAQRRREQACSGPVTAAGTGTRGAGLSKALRPQHRTLAGPISPPQFDFHRLQAGSSFRLREASPSQGDGWERHTEPSARGNPEKANVRNSHPSSPTTCPQDAGPSHNQAKRLQ